MRRIAISVEGATERDFVSKILSPYFLQAQISLHAVDIGGNVSVDKVKKELNKLIPSFDVVTTLYDYYKFVRRNGRTIEELERAFCEDLPINLRHKVIPYIQRHEFEALLFSDPQAIGDEFDATDGQIASLKRIASSYNTPEDINDGLTTAPSKRLQNIFPEYEKLLHGPIICEKIGLGNIISQCPRFNNWLIVLKSLR